MSINIVFQEKGKQNIIIQGKPKMAVSELIHVYYKKICASKKDKMTKKFVFQGNEVTPEEGTLLSELGMKDYSVLEIRTTEQMTSAPHEVPKKEEPPQEEPPQEEPPQEEPPQEEPPQEEPPQEEQPAEEQPAEEQPAEEEQNEEQPAEEQPAEEQPAEEEQNKEDDEWD
jgi:outer membrane biosynthesis protein TonB